MSKVLVIFGVTGNQGNSIANFVINDPELSKEYKVRGVTRDPSKAAAKELEKRGIDVVKGDVEDKQSLEQALKGAHTVFAMTTTGYPGYSREREISQGKAIADTAVAADARYIIWSSIPSPAKISGGKLNKVDHFESKYEVEQYIRTLPIKASFFVPGSFMQNYRRMMVPRPVGDGTYAISNVYEASTEIPLIDIEGDTGKWIAAILANPDEYEGKVLCAATRLYTMQEAVDTISRVTGKTVVYKQVPDEVFKGFLPQGFQEQYLQMLQYVRGYGYYGAEQRKLVEWAAEQAKGKLTTFEEWLQRNPLNLQ